MPEKPPLSPEQTNTVEELERVLNEGVEALKTKLSADTNEVIREKFQELLASVEASNEKAKQQLTEAYQKAQTLSSARLREINIDRAEKAYRGIMQLGLKVIENFQKEFSL